MVTLTTTLDQLNALWVFSVTDALTGEVLWYGCEHIRTIPTLRELKRRALNRLPQRLTLELIAPTATAAEGQQLIDTLNSLQPPRYTAGRQAPSRPVRCETTGVLYDNAHKAAVDNGINPSYMYLHLTGHPSYQRCKGLKFRYE